MYLAAVESGYTPETARVIKRDPPVTSGRGCPKRASLSLLVDNLPRVAVWNRTVRV